MSCDSSVVLVIYRLLRESCGLNAKNEKFGRKINTGKVTKPKHSSAHPDGEKSRSNSSVLEHTHCVIEGTWEIAYVQTMNRGIWKDHFSDISRFLV